MQENMSSQKYLRHREFNFPAGLKDPILIFNIFAENLDQEVVINQKTYQRDQLGELFIDDRRSKGHGGKLIDPIRRFRWNPLQRHRIVLRCPSTPLNITFFYIPTHNEFGELVYENHPDQLRKKNEKFLRCVWFDLEY